MKQHTLRGALPILAKFLGRKLGVHVIVGGDRARTDGQTIILPALPENDTAHILAHGYLDHEGAHVRYTDFSAADLPTPMANALWRAAYGLLRRPEARRLLVVITDGQPDHSEATVELIQRCRHAGIEVYGLGIMLDEPVKALFGAPWAVSIADLEALPAAPSTGPRTA